MNYTILNTEGTLKSNSNEQIKIIKTIKGRSAIRPEPLYALLHIKEHHPSLDQDQTETMYLQLQDLDEQLLRIDIPDKTRTIKYQDFNNPDYDTDVPHITNAQILTAVKRHLKPTDTINAPFINPNTDLQVITNPKTHILNKYRDNLNAYLQDNPEHNFTWKNHTDAYYAAFRSVAFYNANHSTHAILLGRFSSHDLNNLWDTDIFQITKQYLNITVEKDGRRELKDKHVILYDYDTGHAHSIKLTGHQERYNNFRNRTKLRVTRADYPNPEDLSKARTDYLKALLDNDATVRTQDFFEALNDKVRTCNLSIPESDRDRIKAILKDADPDAIMHGYRHTDYPVRQLDCSVLIPHQDKDSSGIQKASGYLPIFKEPTLRDRQLSYYITEELHNLEVINKWDAVLRDANLEQLDKLERELRTMPRNDEYLAKLDHYWKLLDELDSAPYTDGYSDSVSDDYFDNEEL